MKFKKIVILSSVSLVIRSAFLFSCLSTIQIMKPDSFANLFKQSVCNDDLSIVSNSHSTPMKFTSPIPNSSSPPIFRSNELSSPFHAFRQKNSPVNHRSPPPIQFDTPQSDNTDEGMPIQNIGFQMRKPVKRVLPQFQKYCKPESNVSHNYKSPVIYQPRQTYDKYPQQAQQKTTKIYQNSLISPKTRRYNVNTFKMTNSQVQTPSTINLCKSHGNVRSYGNNNKPFQNKNKSHRSNNKPYYNKSRKNSHQKEQPLSQQSNLLETSIIPSPFNKLFPFLRFDATQTKHVYLLLNSTENTLIQGTTDLVLCEIAIVNATKNNPSLKIIYICDSDSHCSQLMDHWECKLKLVNLSCTSFKTFNKSANIIISTSTEFHHFINKYKDFNAACISLIIVDQLAADTSMDESLESLLIRIKMDFNSCRLVIFSKPYNNISLIGQWLNIHSIQPVESKEIIKSTLSQSFKDELLFQIHSQHIHNTKDALYWLKQSFLFISASNSSDSPFKIIHSLLKTALLELSVFLTDFKLTFYGQCLCEFKLDVATLELLLKIENSASLFDLLQSICKSNFNIKFTLGDKKQLFLMKQQPRILSWFSGNKPKSQIKEIYEKVVILVLGAWTRQVNSIHFINESKRIKNKLITVLVCLMTILKNKGFSNAFYNAYTLLRFTRLENCEDEESEINDYRMTATIVNNIVSITISSTDKEAKQGRATLLCFANSKIVHLKELAISELLKVPQTFKAPQKTTTISYMLLFDEYLGMDLLQQLHLNEGEVKEELDIWEGSSIKPFQKLDNEVKVVEPETIEVEKYKQSLNHWIFEHAEVC